MAAGDRIRHPVTTVESGCALKCYYRPAAITIVIIITFVITIVIVTIIAVDSVLSVIHTELTLLFVGVFTLFVFK